ncbi:hypothetical protein Q8A64_16735 [Oxalobacteraceae bacterium R-40]|uniref:Uncharacterized protein n=1 Tax=Keguizhuia sedimenti TaxID=3064264 RepID=A0ABU1BSR6_9BURK|nr:hypothetical protein [Oxalobacteraceae bacterium R-40]
MPINKNNFEKSVFINCPFDDKYLPILEAIAFTVLRCGGEPKLARLEADANEIRLNKIIRLMEESRLGIHDLSRTKLDRGTKTPRFNMPFELGLDMACRQWSKHPHHKSKRILILASSQFEYQKFLSDISGQDIHAHGDDPIEAIRGVRDFLNMNKPGKNKLPYPGPKTIGRDLAKFRAALPMMLKTIPMHKRDLTMVDYIALASEWIVVNC